MGPILLCLLPLNVLVSAWKLLVSPFFVRSVLSFLLIMTQASTLSRDFPQSLQYIDRILKNPKEILHLL